MIIKRANDFPEKSVKYAIEVHKHEDQDYLIEFVSSDKDISEAGKFIYSTLGIWDTENKLVYNEVYGVSLTPKQMQEGMMNIINNFENYLQTT